MGTAYGQPFTGSFWHTAAPYGQPWTTPPQFQGCSGRRPTAEPEQERELNPAYCLIDEDGTLKPFSSASQMSGRSHENMISKIFDSGGPRTLRAVEHQNRQERERLEKSREAVALLLQKTVSDHAGHAMMKKGVAEERAEVDTVFIGCFEDVAKRTSTFCNATVSATCAEVQHVLVEICSDSRFVAMKLYQIELQSCLVARQGYFSEEANPLSRQTLIAQTTGFAIIFNRIALRMKTEELAKEFGLKNVCQLLQEGKLHIAHFQPEAALPGALSMARDADQKAREASQKVRELEDKLQGTTPALTKTVWVRQLQKDDTSGFEFAGNAFQVKEKDLQNIDDLKKAIEKEMKLTIPAPLIDIYIQEDGSWTKQTRMGASLRKTDEDDVYGYVLP